MKWEILPLKDLAFVDFFCDNILRFLAKDIPHTGDLNMLDETIWTMLCTIKFIF